MAAIPKRVAQRITTKLKIFKKVLAEARNADRSEQDTVTIVTDMLAEVFGYDKYKEITGEYAIRGTFCDIAVRVDGKIKFLIEVKSVGKSLKDHHLRQATDYAAKEGIEWVVLTNGIKWQAYRMIFEKPVSYDHVFTIDLMNVSSETNELLYMLSREGIAKQKITEYHEQRQVLNRYFISAIALSEPVLRAMKRELRKIFPKVKIDLDDIKAELENQVIKRDIVEEEEFETAVRRTSRASGRKQSRKARKAATARSAPVSKSLLSAAEPHNAPFIGQSGIT